MKNLFKKIFFPVFLAVFFLPIISFAAQTYPWSSLGSGGQGYSPAALVDFFYRYGIYVVGALAVGMFVYGGILYSTSGGNPARKKEAKDVIFNTIFGIVLLFGAYLILSTINPDLVKLKDPNIKQIETMPTPEENKKDNDLILYSPSNPCVWCIFDNKENKVRLVKRDCYMDNEATNILKGIAAPKLGRNCTESNQAGCVSLDKLGCEVAVGIKNLRNSIGKELLVITKGYVSGSAPLLSTLEFAYFGDYTNSNDVSQKSFYAELLAKGLNSGIKKGYIVSASAEGALATNSNTPCSVSLDDVLNQEKLKTTIKGCNPDNFVVKFVNRLEGAEPPNILEILTQYQEEGCILRGDKDLCKIDASSKIGSGGSTMKVGECSGVSCSESYINSACSTSLNLNTSICSMEQVNKYDKQIRAAAKKSPRICGNIDSVKMIKAIISQESNGVVSAKSGAGAYGLTQLLPATANSNTYKDACNIPRTTTIDGKWLTTESNVEKIVCITIEYLKNKAKSKCGCDIKNLAASYNGGPDACELSRDCSSCNICGTTPTMKWQCYWDDKAHTVCNQSRVVDGKVVSYKETREYVPEVYFCYSKF